MNDEPNYDRILENIAACRDVDKLMAFMKNARKQNVVIVEDAALKQLKATFPNYKKDSYERAFWDMILGYQTVLLNHGKPTVKLAKAWKTALVDSETQAHNDWIENGDQVWAREYLLANSSKPLTAENLILKFPNLFDLDVQDVARQSLQASKARS